MDYAGDDLIGDECYFEIFCFFAERRLNRVIKAVADSGQDYFGACEAVLLIGRKLCQEKADKDPVFQLKPKKSGYPPNPGLVEFGTDCLLGYDDRIFKSLAGVDSQIIGVY